MRIITSFLLSTLQWNSVLGQSVSTLFLYGNQVIDSNIYDVVSCDATSTFSSVYTTITDVNSAAVNYTLTSTIAQPTNSAPGTVQVLIPPTYLTITQFNVDGLSGPVTRTLVSPTGTSPGIVAILSPISYVTTVLYDTVVAPTTSTYALPSGSAPGSVEIISPFNYVTITGLGTQVDGTVTTTIVPASDQNAGTVELLAPSAYVTTTLLNSGTEAATLTSTIAEPNVNQPGTVEILTPRVYTTITSLNTGNDATPVTTTLAEPTADQPGTVEVLTPRVYTTITTLNPGTDATPVTSTLAEPSDTIAGTVEVLIPRTYVTTTTYYSTGFDGTSTTTIEPTDTVPGTVEIYIPVSYATVTLPYTFGSDAGLPLTTTVADPSDDVPGTVNIFTSFYTTIYIGTGTDPISTTTIAYPTDNAPGTIEVIIPTTIFVTTSSQVTGDTVVITTATSTIASPSGTAPGTIELILPNYNIVTTTGGFTGTFNTLATPTGTDRGTIQQVIPTPNQACGNQGIQFAIQSNPYIRGLAAVDPTYSSFSALPFQTSTPQATGITNYIGVPNIPRDTQGYIYGFGPRSVVSTAVNHRAYLFAKISGNFTFDFPLSDDITLLWVGANAYGPTYRRSLANLEQLYNGAIPASQQISKKYSLYLAQGQYMPIRVLWANAQFDANFQFNIFAPDGELITNSSAAFISSPFIVQYSCDLVSAPQFQNWGFENVSLPATATARFS